MNTEKTYGEIGFNAFDKASNPQTSHHKRWEIAARAVIDAYVERETAEGWRLLEVGEERKFGDQIDNLPEHTWSDWNPKEPFDHTQKRGSYPCRRRCRFLKESPPQDERASTKKVGASTADIAGSPAVDTLPDAPDFISELRNLINKRSMENASNTPDFILAQYLTNCLRAWNQATQQRETWYGRAINQPEGGVANDYGQPVRLSDDLATEGPTPKVAVYKSVTLLCAENPNLMEYVSNLEQANDRKQIELCNIRESLQGHLDRDKDDTTTFHLAVIAGNALASLRAQLASAKEENQEYVDAAKVAADESCTAGEKHCTCVPLLRVKLRKLKEMEEQLAAAPRWIPVSEHPMDRIKRPFLWCNINTKTYGMMYPDSCGVYPDVTHCAEYPPPPLPAQPDEAEEAWKAYQAQHTICDEDDFKAGFMAARKEKV